MSAHGHPSPTQIRSSLDHPVIDGDGHWVEFDPVFAERMRKVGGDLAADGFLAALKTTQDALGMSLAERRRRRIAQPAFWSRQAENTLDRATAMMPRLLYERLPELGTDFAIIYPTAGLRLPRIHDDATRRAVIRAHNVVTADAFRNLGDRLTPAAIIPMHTPEEAIAELEYVTRELGAKVGMFGSGMSRRLSTATQSDPDATRIAVWYDVLALDSDHDYDPVWAKCAELGIAPTFHSAGSNQGLRLSPSNFVYNHIGHFAAAGHAVCKAVFLGGVTRRFPELRFAFLEGGVGWASQLFGDLLEHWERRSARALERMDPRKLDRALLMSLAEKYGDADTVAALEARDGWPDHDVSLTGGVADLDDFSACKITRKQDWIDLYVTPFYFGCEADDRMNATAFSPHNPFGAKLNALYSSDIGHFDVIDMRDPLAEAHELVEDGVISADNFRDFTFANAVHLWGTQNPLFFEGTAVAKAAAEELTRPPVRPTPR
ncbi:MAG: amidohydrolase [Candidatus Rokuibacteriota bacterium]|nr:MAG: amidohydrolase [Candidatus Rokubacteria bacterium]